jgi:hypothetical protein
MIMMITVITVTGRTTIMNVMRNLVVSFFYRVNRDCMLLERQIFRKWLRHYVTSWKVSGSRHYVVNEFPQLNLILPAAPGPRVYSGSIRNEYQKQKNVSGE